MSAFGIAVPLWAPVLGSVGCVIGLVVAWVVGVVLVEISGLWARAIGCGVYAILSGTALGMPSGGLLPTSQRFGGQLCQSP